MLCTKQDTKGYITLVTNGTIFEKEVIEKIKKLMKGFSIQVSLYQEYIEEQLLFIEEASSITEVYAHVVVSKNNIDDFNFFKRILGIKLPIWIGFDRFPSEDITTNKIDSFFDFLYKNKSVIHDKEYLFLKDRKKTPGKECMHLIGNGMYVNEFGDRQFCSTIQEPTTINKKCSVCSNILCRACTCDILTPKQRELSCYFYSKVGDFYG